MNPTLTPDRRPRSSAPPQDIAGDTSTPGRDRTGSTDTRSGWLAQRQHRATQTAPPSLADPAPELPPGAAKVKLALQPRTDAELVAFCESQAQAMVGNPHYTDPQPPVAVFDEKLGEFEAVLSELENLRLRVLNLTQKKDRIRQEVEFLCNQRGSYVQMVSRGNADAIASAGLTARRPRRRLGTLPAPQGLRLLVTQISGQLLVRWATVPGARAYVLECAPVIPGQPYAWEQVHIGGQLRTLIPDLTPGQAYAFRLTAIGGATGRSAWSPVVQRMVG